MIDVCGTCETTMCFGACSSLDDAGIPKPLVRRIVLSCIGQKLGEDGECRVTQDEIDLFLDKTHGSPTGMLPAEPKFVVDMTLVQCGCGCEKQVFEVQAKDLGWGWGTFLPGGGSAWRCRDSARADADNPLF